MKKLFRKYIRTNTISQELFTIVVTKEMTQLEITTKKGSHIF